VGENNKLPIEGLPEATTFTSAPGRGYLKIFLGYASGVGKTFRMLDEARRRSLRGQDVVIGAVQPRMGPESAALLEQLEVVPLKKVGAGTAVDVNVLLRRQPGVCFIDGLAYDNPPGSPNKTRWEDVAQLVQAGIKVIASVNIQYISELREQVEGITGKPVAHTVPIAFIKSADEIEIVDAPAMEAQRRSSESSGAGPSGANPSGANEDPRRLLLRLREMALVLAADVVDHQLAEYLASHGIRQQLATQERILVCLTGDSNAQLMIETAKVIAKRFYGELIVVNVDQPEISSLDRAALDDKLSLARAAGIRVEILHGRDPMDTILQFARSRAVTQIFVGHSRSSRVWSRMFGNSLNRLIRQSRGMDVRIFPNRP
jgi:two-component system sensor histidine kinase KdpD